MRSHSLFSCSTAAVIVLAAGLPLLAQSTFLTLPKARTDGGKPLMRALSERRTTRAFTDRTLSPQQLSDLFWAAFGVNRGQSEKAGFGRTAPSARNRQEIDLYAALPDGVYLYEAEAHRLRLVASGDIRPKTGSDAAARAAVTILYVADSAKAGSTGDTASAPAFAAVDTGFIGQNVYLFAASEGLGAWFRATIPDARALGATLKLRPTQHLLFVQTVGYPAPDKR
ncbi:SagB/ThcOx family dehydrogenase [uncultured Paludibaculum sp.]|uniref:nitroreductase family protein n=1 Tax=uncultured Paludibaculum sp. TaxID=1765020 RepID=UPI002AAC2CF3|nr:SagB/ThcOx family dehydrogenase [uncultured Paludibaculum sp.]